MTTVITIVIYKLNNGMLVNNNDRKHRMLFTKHKFKGI